MKSRYWGNQDKAQDKPFVEHSSWKDPHEGIWIDCERFQSLFAALTPWGEGDYSDALGTRCFRVIIYFLELFTTLILFHFISSKYELISVSFFVCRSRGSTLPSHSEFLNLDEAFCNTLAQCTIFSQMYFKNKPSRGFHFRLYVNTPY